MQKLKEVLPGTAFKLASGNDAGTFLKIRKFRVPSGEPWEPGKEDPCYNAARCGTGELVEISEESDVLVCPTPA